MPVLVEKLSEKSEVQVEAREHARLPWRLRSKGTLGTRVVWGKLRFGVAKFGVEVLGKAEACAALDGEQIELDVSGRGFVTHHLVGFEDGDPALHGGVIRCSPSE